MKRPLCLALLAFYAAICLFLSLYPPDMTNLYPDDQRVDVTGLIVAKDHMISQDYRGESADVQVITIQTKDQDPIKVKCYMDSTQDLLPSIGTFVHIQGNCKNFSLPTNPGEFNSKLFYKTLKIEYSIKNAKIIAKEKDADRITIREALYRVKIRCAKICDQTLSQRDSQVMKAILLGDKSDLDQETKDLFKSNGIIHILSISGLHISIIGIGLYKLLRKMHVSNLLSMGVSFGAIVLYGMLCGMALSMVRAMVMFGISLLAPVVHRTYDMLTALCLAGLLMLIEQPLYVYNSGFLLSFGALVGIGLILPATNDIIPDNIWGNKSAGSFVSEKSRIRIWIENTVNAVIQGFKCSMAVMLATLPVYSLYFHTISPYAVFLNIVVVPLMGILVPVGLALIGLGSAFVVAGILPAMICHAILQIYFVLCEKTSQIEGALMYIGHASGLQIAAYIALIISFVLTNRIVDKLAVPIARQRMTIRSVKLTLILTSVTLLMIHPRPDLKITFLDVGQGDGIVVESGGKKMLIDGGSTSNRKLGDYVLTPFLAYEGIGKLDACIITHEDQDHISGLVDLIAHSSEQGVEIGELILPDIAMTSKGKNYQELVEMASVAGIEIHYISRGDVLELGDTKLRCLEPERGMVTDEPNAYSTVLYAQKSGFSILLTGDVDGAGQEALKKTIMEENISNLTILKVAHHGSKYTTDQEFLDTLKPRVAIISCGEDNKYGHPHAETMERLDKVGSQTLITKDAGAITITIQDDRLSIDQFID